MEKSHQVVIWKFRLSPTGVIDIPKNSEFLSLQLQNGEPTLWFLVPVTENPVMVERYFFFHATGVEWHPGNEKYLGTIQVDVFVWHLFEHYEQPSPTSSSRRVSIWR